MSPIEKSVEAEVVEVGKGEGNEDGPSTSLTENQLVEAADKGEDVGEFFMIEA